MKIYDELTKKEISNPDLSSGYLYAGTIVTGKTEPTTKIMSGSITSDRLNGLREYIPSKDIVEECQYYHKYTEEDKETALAEKLNELKGQKDSRIQNGADIMLSDGTKKHFSYGISNQTDISTMFNAIMLGMDSYIYHSEDGGCAIYGKEDIILIHSTLSSLKTKEETYFGQLSDYVKSLSTVPNIQKVSYGDELTGTYLEEYNRLLAYAMTQMQNLIERLKANAT